MAFFFRSIRYALLALAVVGAGVAVADQKIKTKSNIKNDRMAETPASGASAVAAVEVKPVAPDAKAKAVEKPKQP